MATLPSQVRDSIVGLMMPVSNNLSIIKKGDQVFSTVFGHRGVTAGNDGGLLSQNAGVHASGVLSEAVQEAPGTTIQSLILSSAQEAAQFRAGDQVFLVGNDFAGVVAAGANTADGPLTVLGTSPVNQSIRVSGRNTAGTSDYAIGSIVLRAVDANGGGAVGGVIDNSAQGAGYFDAPAYARMLEGLVTAIVDNNGAPHDVTTGTNLNVEITSAGLRADLATYGQTIVGGTLTFATGTGDANNNGYTATVATIVNGTAGTDVRLTLTDIRDAAGAAQATMAAVTTNNTVVFQHNWPMADAAIADLRETGGDLTRLVAAAAQINRRLNPTGQANSFEMDLDQAYQVEQVQKGVRLRLAAPLTTHATDPVTVVVEMDEAVGDIPVPLAGTLSIVDYGTGVNSLGPNINNGAGQTRLARRPAAGYAAYTRARGSNELTAVLPGVAVDYDAGVMVEFSIDTTGVVTNQGWAPTIDPAQQMSWLLAQILDSVDNYDSLGT